MFIQPWAVVDKAGDEGLDDDGRVPREDEHNVNIKLQLTSLHTSS